MCPIIPCRLSAGSAEVDLKQAPSVIRKNIGILGCRGSSEFEELSRLKITREIR